MDMYFVSLPNNSFPPSEFLWGHSCVLAGTHSALLPLQGWDPDWPSKYPLTMATVLGSGWTCKLRWVYQTPFRKSGNGYEKNVHLFPSRILGQESLELPVSLLAVEGESLAENEGNTVYSRAKGQRKQDRFLLWLVTFLDWAKFHSLNSPLMWANNFPS